MGRGIKVLLMSFHEKDTFYRDRIFEKQYPIVTPELKRNAQKFAASWALKEKDPSQALAEVLEALDLH